MRTARRGLISSCVLMLCVIPTPAQGKNDGPSNEKAQKTYKEALKCLLERRTDFALGALKKADKQDDGKVPGVPARNGQVRNAARRMEDAELGAEELVAEAQDERSKALAHYQFAVLLMSEGLQRHKEEYFARVHEEASKAIAAYAKFPDAMFIDGRALAQLKQDEAAKSKFDEFVKLKPEGDANRRRAQRFISQPELAQERMAPVFEVTTVDGKRVSMDDLQGKVVLLDFWATQGGPCREALPHMQKVAKKFQGEPLVILSISLDNDEQKWKEFIGKNEMTWLQSRDGGFEGPVAKLFGVAAIPHTFTIDADGVLQEEHTGDASIEGKPKKLIANARALPPPENPATGNL